MVGSKNFFADDYDGQVNVTMSLRQPGSAIKPVTYVTGFRKGMTPATMLMDVPTSFPSGDGSEYKPVNYDGSYRGPIQLRFALGSSLNVPAVKLLAMVGIRDMLQTAYDMGISTLEPTSENLRRFGLAVTLGGAEVRLTELTAAYSAFANGGTKVEPVFILKVEDRDGKTLFEHKSVTGKRVLQEEETFLINHVLSDNNARLLTFGANSFLNLGQRPVAVKTGTTNDKRDNWTIGWSRNVMVGVWVGNNDNSPMKQVASGVTGASPIWRRIMLEFLDEYPAEAWPIPSRVQAVMVDTVSGYPEHDGFPARSEYVIAGTLPDLPDPIHTRLKLCRDQDKLASEVDIARGNYDEKEYFVFTESTPVEGRFSWQEAIDAWTSNHPDPKYKAPKEFCDSSSEMLVTMERPEKETSYESTTIPIRVRVVYQGEIDRVEILVDGSSKKTLTSRPFESELTLDPGRYRLRARVITKDGKQSESSERQIGVGGVSWNEPAPTAIPQPTVAPTPVPSPTLGIVVPTGL
jgi:membrane carboxypeptidase/penicillin-binding protein PbpC